jgi:hypothetical protein
LFLKCYISAIAQEDTTSLDEEDLASGIVSDVLEGSGDDDDEVNDDNAADIDEIVDQDSTDTATVNSNQEDQTVDQDDTVIFGDGANTQTAIPIIDQDREQDQGAANLSLNEALDVTVEPIPTPDDGLPPECPLDITTDKETYDTGDVVIITVTNTGEEVLVFPNSGLGLQIKNLGTGAVLPLYFAQVETELQPGESTPFRFTYEDLVREIGSGTIEASVGGGGECSSVTFMLTAIIIV